MLVGIAVLTAKVQTLESFDFSFNPSVSAVRIKELATCHFIDHAESVFHLGPTGTGKTHLARALSHMACRLHLTVDFYSFCALFAALLRAELAGRIDHLLSSLTRGDLLVIDDFAFKKID